MVDNNDFTFDNMGMDMPSDDGMFGEQASEKKDDVIEEPKETIEIVEEISYVPKKNLTPAEAKAKLALLVREKKIKNKLLQIEKLVLKTIVKNAKRNKKLNISTIDLKKDGALISGADLDKKIEEVTMQDALLINPLIINKKESLEAELKKIAEEMKKFMQEVVTTHEKVIPPAELPEPLRHKKDLIDRKSNFKTQTWEEKEMRALLKVPKHHQQGDIFKEVTQYDHCGIEDEKSIFIKNYSGFSVNLKAPKVAPNPKTHYEPDTGLEKVDFNKLYSSLVMAKPSSNDEFNSKIPMHHKTAEFRPEQTRQQTQVYSAQSNKQPGKKIIPIISFD